MHQKQIVTVFFSIVLLSGITGTFSPTSAYAVEENKVWRVYVEPVPSWASIGNALTESFDYWEKRDGIKFEFVGENSPRDFLIQWVKDFGQKKIGHAVYSKWVEISLGDSKCGDQWNPFSSGTIKNLAIHEIGHAIGYNHESQTDSYMYPIIQDEHYASITYHQTIPEHWYYTFQTCTFSNPTYLSFKIESPDQKTKFDAYFVPTREDAVNAGTNKKFNWYPSCSSEDTFNVYGSPCQMAGGSWLVIKDLDRSITLDIELKEGYDYTPKIFQVYASPATSSKQIPVTKLQTELRLNSPTGTYTYGDMAQFSGTLLYKNGDGTYGYVSGANIKISDINEYKTSEKSYIPQIGTAVTDQFGKFLINWKTIHHTGAYNEGTSVWTPKVQYSGSDKFLPISVTGSSFFVKDKQQVQQIKDTDNDGILDNVDSCIYETENFNSYQDSDGCPDTQPQQETTYEASSTKSESIINIKNGFQNEAIEDDRITIMGTLREVFSRTSESNYGSYSMPNEKIVVRSSNGKIIGSDYTDENSDFQITINFDLDESVHTIMTQDDVRKYFKMPIIFEYEGNSKVNPDTEDRSRDVYLRDENYKAEEHPKKSYSDDGDLSVDRNEFVRSQHSSITINGNAYWIADRGEIVNLYVINPDNVKQEHKVRLTSEKTFSLSIPLNSNSPLGWYEVGGYYIQKNDSYQPEQYFNPISFKVVNQITITDYVSKNDPVESPKVTPIETPNVTPPQQVDKPIIVQPVKEPELKTSAEDSQRDDAIRLHEHYQQARVDLQKGIKTAENSLSGLKYSSPEAQKKIEDAWSVRWMALTDLKTINDKMYSAEIELQEHHYVKAIKLLQEIDSYPKKISDDLTWISKSITDAEKLEKDHKSQDFLAFAFNSGEGKTCIWFICW